MLYMLGSLSIDTSPFPADQMNRSASATWAEKAVMGTLPPSEFMGQGPETLTFTGQLLPYKLGGLDELETLRKWMREGTVLPVMRGDGARLGSYGITSISDAHKHLQREGVGFVVGYSLALKKMPDNDDGRQQTIESLLSLFDAFF